MRIVVKENEGKNINLRLPSGLVLSRLSAAIISSELKHKQVNISGKQLYTLFRAIKAYKKGHPEWKLVEVYGQDSSSVDIVI